MQQEQLDLAIRRFLKQVGISSHQELQAMILKAHAQGKLKPGQTLPVSMTLELPELELCHRFDGVLSLDSETADDS